MVVAVQQPGQKPEPDLVMHYRCSIYGLGVISNRTIPGVPPSTIASEDVRISFGSLPAWLDEVTAMQVETSYVADYKSECGEPALRVFVCLTGSITGSATPTRQSF